MDAESLWGLDCGSERDRLSKGGQKGGFLCYMALGEQEGEDKKISTFVSALPAFSFSFPISFFLTAFLSQILSSGITFSKTVPNTFCAQALFKNQS